MCSQVIQAYPRSEEHLFGVHDAALLSRSDDDNVMSQCLLLHC